MSQRVPDDEDTAGFFAAEGTLAHSIGEAALNPGDRYEQVKKKWLGWVTTVEGHEVTVTEEMLDAVWQYVTYVREATANTSIRSLETRAPMDLRGRLFMSGTELGATARDRMFGTIDCLITNPTERRIHVIDYKHGAGVYVRAEGNPQLRYYALLALTSLDHSWFKLINHVDMTIVQPRHPMSEPIRHDSIDAIELIEWGRDELIPAAHEALTNDNAPLVPSEECRFCSAAALCPALRSQRMEDAKLAFDDTGRIEPTVNPDELSVEDMARVLESVPNIRSWLNAVEKRAKDMLHSEISVPGFKLVPTRPTRQWIDEKQAADKLCETYGYGDEDIYEQRILSPAKVEKLIGKNKQARALLDDLTQSVSSGVPIAPESDSRPAVEPAGTKRAGAADAFGDD